MATQSLAREFAAKYAEGVVPANLKAIAQSKRANMAVLGAAVACTYIHQAHYLASVDGFSLGHIGGVDVSLGYVAPLIWDIVMVRNASTLQTPAMAKAAKSRALFMMIAGGAVSATINVIAPGALIARIIFAVLVAIAVGQKWASAAIKPDFAALEDAEQAATAEAAPAASEGRKCPTGCTCGKHTPKTTTRKAKTPAKPRTRKTPAVAPKTPKAPTYLPATFPGVAPVSPAPGGRMTDSGLWIATH